jgi:hypothetical protein
MSYPTSGAYQEAVQFPSTAFSDPLLKEAEPEETALGLPRAITGAFAVVFPMHTRGARWAVKCFVTEVRDQHDRYRAIAAHLNACDLPYSVPFEYQDGGIRVDGDRYPILKMEWIEGEPLNRFVARHLERPGAIASLIEAWREMVDALETSGIAHGDLQHGNVLVEEDGSLRLVDYDTMLVPKLSGWKSLEVGHRNYQHPDRDEKQTGLQVDRFAALVIDTGLRACAVEPALWERFDTGENILFRSTDLANPDGSALFDALSGVDALSEQVDALRRACYLEPEDIPPLAVVVSDAASVPTRAKRRREKGAFERFIYPSAAVVLVVVAIIQIVDSVEVGLIALAAGLAGGAVWAWLRYRNLPVVRRRRRLEREEAYFRRLMEGLRDELRRLERLRDEMIASHAAHYAERLAELQEEALDERLKHHFIAEVREVEEVTHKVVVRLKASGIRTAAHATPERVASVPLMSDESKARVNLWRAALAAQYEGDVPVSLSPAEERRLQRALDHELEAVDAELRRVRRKIAVQEEEQSSILQRKEGLDVPSFGQHVASVVLRSRE